LDVKIDVLFSILESSLLEEKSVVISSHVKRLKKCERLVELIKANELNRVIREPTTDLDHNNQNVPWLIDLSAAQMANVDQFIDKCVTVESISALEFPDCELGELGEFCKCNLTSTA